MDGRCLKKEYMCDGIPDCVVDFGSVLDEKMCLAPGRVEKKTILYMTEYF